MIILRKILRNIIPILIIFCAVVFAYWDIPKTFFQQDEWISFARMIVYETTGGIENVLRLPFIQGRGHFTPLSYYQLYLEFKLFGLSFEPFALISIFTHIVNSLLLFYFANLLLKNKFLAFCSGLIFAVGVVSNQAVTWIAASPNTQGAVLFLLLSLIFILKYLQSDKKRSYYMGLFFFFIGMLFKEIILFFFILAPLMWVLFAQKSGKRNLYLFLKPLIIFGFIYFLIRASLFLVPSPVFMQKGNTVNLSFKTDIVRLASSPFKILPQAIIPQQYLINVSDIATFYFYPQYTNNGLINAYFSQTAVFGQVIPLLSIPIILIGFFIYKLLLFKKENNLAKAVVFSLFLVALSGLPFAFIPGDLADLPIYEPRNLHVAVIGASIFLVLIVYGIVRFFLKQNKYAYPLFFFILMPFLLMHLYLTRAEVYRVVNVSNVRKYVLESIKKSYPKLPQKVVFYTQSDTAYYGMPIEEKALPVQVGFGWMLLVWYQKDEKFPVCLFDFEPEAFHMLTQRYRECDERGFGYFRDYDKLINAIRENNISADSIIAYFWKGKTKDFKDITKQLRIKIKKDFYETAK